MWIFLVLFVVSGCINTSLSFTLSGFKKAVFIAITLCGVYCLLVYPWILQMTSEDFNAFFNLQSVEYLSLCLIGESVLNIILSVYYIKAHYSKKYEKLIRGIFLFPFPVFLGGIFLLEAFTFIYHSEHWSYPIIAFSFAAIVILALSFSFSIFKSFFTEWDVRIKLKVIISSIQLLAGIFLPMVISEIKTEHGEWNIDLFSFCVCFGIILSFSFWGFMKYQLKLKLKK